MAVQSKWPSGSSVLNDSATRTHMTCQGVSQRRGTMRGQKEVEPPKNFELFLCYEKFSRELSHGLYRPLRELTLFTRKCCTGVALARTLAEGIKPYRELSRALATKALSQKLSRSCAPRTVAEAAQSYINPLHLPILPLSWKVYAAAHFQTTTP